MDSLLSVDQVAELLGVKTSTIYQWTHQDYIPHVKLGKLVRSREARVMEWIEKRSTKGRINRHIETGELGL
jgi:excisionase family DNA binding protein